jgi:ABC-type phosphate transport system substrate-binding protein
LRRLFVILPVLLIPAMSPRAAVGADASAVRVIVNPQVRGSQMTRTALTQIFLKQAARWGDGSPAQPVDQSLKSPVRTVFSNRLLGQPVMEVQIYWQRRMAQGLTPPPVRTSDEEVVTFVAQTPGAIGYVSSSTTLPDSVKAVEISN